MKTTFDHLPSVLATGIASAYLVSGDETLLVGEAADAIRACARAAGYQDRQVFFIERGFDWDEVRTAAQSLSLFSERRMLELRMPTGKPDRGADFLAELIGKPPPDTLLLILTDKLDSKAMGAAWVRALERQGVYVPILPVGLEALPGWLRERAARVKLQLDADAAQLIAASAEGNLLAAAQEIDKLALLSTDGRIPLQLVRDSVGANARYDVFALSGAAAAGHAGRALHVLAGLKGEGVEPTLILWALSRELRGLWQAGERNRLRSNERSSAWNLASQPSAAALARIPRLPLARLLSEAGNVDRIIKGQARGDAWTALRALTAGLAGALHHSMLSGRVAP